MTLIRSKHLILRPDDILISVKGKVGVAGVVPDGAPKDIFGAWTAGQPFVIARLRRSTPINDPAVLARYLASPFGQTQLQALAGGTTVPLIPMNDLATTSDSGAAHQHPTANFGAN